MYSRKTWGGPVDPHILVKFLKNTEMENSDPIVSMVIFEWEDYDLVGVVPQDDPNLVCPLLNLPRCSGHSLNLS
jgi:hypothetical protein